MRAVLSFLLLVFATVAHGQKEASTWYFSFHNGLKFDSSGVRALTDGAFEKANGPASCMSDENGNLLFYTDGDDVFDRHNSRMPNGFGLGNGSQFSNFNTSPLIVPNPLNNGTYYIFNVILQYLEPPILTYSEVDLSLNSGLGDVTTKRHLLTDSVIGVGVIAAVMHANGRDVWVVTHEWNTNRFQSWLVTATGISPTPVVSSIGSVHFDPVDKQMHISPDGDKIAVTSAFLGGPNSTLEVFNFSVVTGVVSNLFFSVSDWTDRNKFWELYGVEFSPNGNFLYATSGGNRWSVYQFDLRSGNQASILNSVVEVGVALDNGEMGMQLAPDGKIYIAHATGYTGTAISQIKYPNKKGLDCGYSENAVDLGGRYGSNSCLVTLIENYVTPPPSFEFSDLCVLDTTFFYPSSLGYYDSLVWNFGDPASGVLNRSKIKESSHKFSSEGSYLVSLTTYFAGQPRRKAKQQIVLNKMAQVELGSDTTICDGAQVTLSVASGYSQTWSTGETVPSINVTKTGLYKVTLTNGQCTVKDSINVKVLEQPKVNFPDTLIVCTATGKLDSKNPNFHVLWSTGDTTSTITVSQTGLYSVHVNNEKCKAADSVFVRMSRVLNLVASADKDTVGYNDEVAFVASASDILTWKWNFEDGNFSDKQSPKYIYQNEGEYFPTVTVTNSFGCTNSVSVKVFVKHILFIPNVFTPNGDGKNDAFLIEYNGDQNFSLFIYNRWGQEVYHSIGRRNQWNGGTEESGVFYYLVSFNKERYKGWVQLIR
jgi:gliding motility-associated-like protein